MDLSKITRTTGGYEGRGLERQENGKIIGQVFDNIWTDECWYKYGDYIDEPHPYDLDLSHITDPTKPQHYPNAGQNDVIAFCQSNNIGFIEGNVIKYVTRHKDKNGLEDLQKAQEYLNRLIQSYGQRD